MLKDIPELQPEGTSWQVTQRSEGVGEIRSDHVKQEVEYQVDDDKQHHDTDDVTDIQGFLSWDITH
jgi:hypothetical protein